jgi:hypothetical protein
MKTNSGWVQEHIYFPEDWHTRWPVFHRDIVTFNIDGKGQKADGPDVLTGIAEQFNKQTLTMF